MSFKVVHYINQFFANIGGEEMAHVPPEKRDGFVGPGMAFNPCLQRWSLRLCLRHHLQGGPGRAGHQGPHRYV